MSELSYFDRTRIQMEYVVPLIRDLQDLLGEKLVNDALDERNRRREQNTEVAPTAAFENMAAGAKVYAAGGALTYDIIASGSDHFDMNVQQCGYASMMDELGGRDIGHLLLCGRDFASARRLGMQLERSQTRMQGADFCDFRYKPAISTQVGDP